MEFLSSIGSFIITPLYYLISVVLVGWHRVFGAIFGPESGASWALSIIFLTLVIRAALIPLFVKQIKSSRNMQLIQPKVKELQKKYGHDRERLAQETMKLYKDSGTNPFASCLPILLQMPIFFALFRLIDHAAKNETSLMLALRPDLVDLAQLPADRAIWPQGVGGEDPRDATAEHGQACIDTCLALLAAHLQALGIRPAGASL